MNAQSEVIARVEFNCKNELVHKRHKSCSPTISDLMRSASMIIDELVNTLRVDESISLPTALHESVSSSQWRRLVKYMYIRGSQIWRGPVADPEGKSGHGAPSKLSMEFGPPRGQKE